MRIRLTAFVALLWLFFGLSSASAQEAMADIDNSDAVTDDDWDMILHDFPMDEDLVYETTVVGIPLAEEGLSRKRIDRKEIDRRGSDTVAETLEHEPAVFASSGKKGERTFRLRGFHQRGVSVYLDGVPFAMPYDGSVDLGKIPVQMLDSVLVLKGPTSIVHGPGGMGGAVLMETKDPEDAPSVDAHMALSDDREVRGTIYHGYNPGPFSYALGLGSSTSNGYSLSSQFEPTELQDGLLLENSERRLQHVAWKLVVPMGKSNEFVSQAFVVDGEFGIPRSTTDTRPFFSRFTTWRATVGQVAHRLESGNTKIEQALYIAAFDNELNAYDDSMFTTQDGPNAYTSWYRDRTFGGRIKSQQTFYGLPGGPTYVRLWLGAQNDAHSAVLDTNEAEQNFERTLFTIVPELEIPIVSGLVAIASAQIDVELTHNEDAVVEDYDETLENEAAAEFGPLISLRWDPLDVLMIRLSGARRNRIPTLSERYSSRLGFTRANPDLEPETAWHVGLDLKLDILSDLKIEVSAYDAEITNMISSEYLPETNGVTQKQNIGRARLAGFESFLCYFPTEKLGFKGGYSYLFARRLDPDDNEDRVAQIPAHQAVFGVLAGPWYSISFDTSVRIIGPQAFDDYSILGLGELGTYAVWDARIEAVPFKGFSIYLRGFNLLDMNYQTRYGYPDRGLNIWVGVRLKVY